MPGDVVAVSGEYALHVEPNESSERIKNEKASKILGEAQYHQIDRSTTVRRLCEKGDWTEVQIVTPEWLADLDAAESVARAFTSHGPAGTAYGNITPLRDEPAVMELQFVGPLFPCTTVAVGTLSEMLERARETIVHGDADFRDAILNVYLPPAVIRG